MASEFVKYGNYKEGVENGRFVQQGEIVTVGLPEPFYEDEFITLYCADNRQVLPLLEPVDLILTDPPYGTLDGKGKVYKKGSELVSFNVGEWDRHLPLEWLNPAIRLLRDGAWLAVFTDKLSVKTLWDAIEIEGGNPKQTFYWLKDNPPPQPRKNFCSGVETAVLATKGAVRNWNGGGWTLNYYRCPIVTANTIRTEHPTQKPTDLFRYLIGKLADSGMTVLDPFCGSGTTLRAAKDLGLKAIGIEIEERFCALAASRLRQGVLNFRE